MNALILTLYLITTWLLLNILYFIPKNNLYIESAFVFMVIAIITRNEYTILALDLDYIILTKKSDLFIAFILYRSLIYPIIMVIFISIFTSMKKAIGKTLVVLAAFSILFLAEFLALKIHLVQYVKWNLFFHSIFIGLIILTAYLSFYLMNSSIKRVIHK